MLLPVAAGGRPARNVGQEERRVDRTRLRVGRVRVADRDRRGVVRELRRGVWLRIRRDERRDRETVQVLTQGERVLVVVERLNRALGRVDPEGAEHLALVEDRSRPAGPARIAAAVGRVSGAADEHEGSDDHYGDQGRSQRPRENAAWRHHLLAT